MPSEKFNYWFFKKAIPSKICDDIINLGLDRKPKLAETFGSKAKEVSKKDLLKTRNSKTVFLNERWIYDMFFPFVYEANKNSSWNYDIDNSEIPQFTIYKKNQHYVWHQDSDFLTKPYEDKKRKQENGKIRKISVTCQLNDPSEFKGGEFEFDFRNYNPDMRDPKIHEHEVKEIKDKGSIIVFPSHTWHRVKPVTKGTRYSLVIWMLGKPWR